MFPVERNELLTRVGAGTPIGELFRRYWLPVLLGEELPEPDCPPVRVKLLGERLLAFRDTQGRVGLIDEFCAHRHPKIVPTVSPAGLYVATRRDVGTDRYYWRVTQWLMPCFSFFPPYGDNPCGGHAFVPIDDEHCWTFSIDYHRRRALSRPRRTRHTRASYRGQLRPGGEQAQRLPDRPRGAEGEENFFRRVR